MHVNGEYRMAIADYEGMSNNRRHAVAALAAAGLLWGTTVPLSKLALAWLPTGWLTVVRFGLAAAILRATVGALPIAVLTEGKPTVPASAGAVLAVAALALGGTLAPFTLFAFGQSRVSAEVAGGFLNLEPLVGAIAGAVAFGDPIGLVQVAGGLAILAGIGFSSLPLITARRSEARREAATPVGTAPEVYP